MNFDEQYWQKAVKRPGWYLEFSDFAQEIRKNYQDNQDQLDKLTKQIRRFFEKALQEDKVALGKDGYNFDEERQPIEKVQPYVT